MKIPPTTKLNIPTIIHAASRLKCKGRLAKLQNNFTYLDIDDAYIHTLFPLLQDQQIKKPDYFGEEAVGAHITVIYPGESKEINEEDLNQEYDFAIKELVAVKIEKKTYYAILVESPSLMELRKKYDLPNLLCFKSYSIGFHITIGVKV